MKCSPAGTQVEWSLKIRGVGSCYFVEKEKKLQGRKPRNMYFLPLRNASAFKGWQTGALSGKRSKKVPPSVRKSTKDFEKKDPPIFIVLPICTLTVNSYVVAVAWEFETLMNILCICVICWAFRLFATDRCLWCKKELALLYLAYLQVETI